ENSVAVPGNIPVKLVKWKVNVGSVIGHGTVLCVYEPENSTNQRRLRSNQVGTVKTLAAKEGDLIKNGEILLVIGGCTHPTVMKDMCAECGADLRDGTPGKRKNPSDASVAMVHSIPELIISQKVTLELGKADEQRLIRDKKLVLLVDLDQTLIHTTNDKVPANLKDVHHFQLHHGRNLLWYHTKFRPGTEKFLERISKLYELHICTFGVRMYAHTIAKLLDPDGKYFSHRILSRDECFNPTSKTGNLKALFPCGDSMVCIIDDREDVWRFSPSLVHVKPYLFFDGTADINAPCGLDKETWEGENVEEKSGEEKKRQQPKYRAKEECKTGKVETEGDEEEEKEEIQEERKTEEKIETEKEKEEEKEEKIEEDMQVDAKIAQEKKADISEDEKDQNTDESREKLKEGKKDADSDYEEMIEWEDSDNYLVYLEDILSRIHTAYFQFYNQMIEKKAEDKQLPDIKTVLPYVKKRVLRGVNILFSGMIPINKNYEKSRAYIVAKSLGANIQTSLETEGEDRTTHVVAARDGTQKINDARKMKGVHIVNADWLWTCAYRWERVDEQLY
ncbi:hypothetical protein CAPTEDRAFT_23527, partial [Capitella teleta]